MELTLAPSVVKLNERRSEEWMSNYIPPFNEDAITYPFPNALMSWLVHFNFSKNGN